MEPKLRVFFAEFPFLRDEFEGLPITDARVSRIDTHLLSRSVVEYATFWRGFSHICFYEKEGGLIFRKKFQVIRFFETGTEERRFESLLSGLVADLTHFVAWYWWDEEGKKILMLYKPPKNHSVVSWLAALDVEAQAKLRAEVAQIDADTGKVK